jgi:hypothetical protein
LLFKAGLRGEYGGNCWTEIYLAKHKWCGSSESGPRGSPFTIPSYLYKDLDKHVLRNFSRFRLRAHQIESGVLQMAWWF